MGANIQKLAKKQVNSKDLGRHKSGLTPPTPPTTRRTSVGSKKTASAASLLRMPVSEIMQDERAVAPVFADCTLLDLLHRLSDENILDVPFSETPDGHCLGQIGIEDFVEYIITTWKDSKRCLSQNQNQNLSSHNEEEKQRSIQHIREHRLGMIFAMLHQRPSPNHWCSDHLEEILTLFAAGVQRVVVQTRSSPLKRAPVNYKILEHRALLRHIAANPKTIDSIASQPAIQLRTPITRIPKVKARDPLICAFLMMRVYPGMPIAVTKSLSEDEDSLLQVRTRGSISLAQAKQMTRSLPLVPPLSPDLQHLQQQKRPKSHPSESQEKSMAGESASTKPEESVVGYLSESDMVRYFVMFENVFNKMHGLSVQSDKERRGKKSVQSELGTELLESITVYAYLKEVRNAQQKDIGSVVSIPSNASLLDAIRTLVREEASYARFTEAQPSPQEATSPEFCQEKLLTTMSILHKIYSYNTRKSTSSSLSSSSSSSSSSSATTSRTKTSSNQQSKQK